jgi:hypothetical protein
MRIAVADGFGDTTKLADVEYGCAKGAEMPRDMS